MKVLVACEFSGIVRDAFARRGHDAWSCDLLPSRTPGNHLQCDVLGLLSLKIPWDLMIAHPPCTYTARSGIHWCVDRWISTKQGRYWHDGYERRIKRDEAVEFFIQLAECYIPRIALEQPLSILATKYRQPDQYIHPWMFGHGEKKKTCLWLKNLPKLCATKFVKGRESKMYNMGPSKYRQLARSRTYTGIAEAMAEQWGSL